MFTELILRLFQFIGRNVCLFSVSLSDPSVVDHYRVNWILLVIKGMAKIEKL